MLNETEGKRHQTSGQALVAKAIHTQDDSRRHSLALPGSHPAKNRGAHRRDRCIVLLE